MKLLYGNSQFDNTDVSEWVSVTHDSSASSLFDLSIRTLVLPVNACWSIVVSRFADVGDGLQTQNQASMRCSCQNQTKVIRSKIRDSMSSVSWEVTASAIQNFEAGRIQGCGTVYSVRFFRFSPVTLTPGIGWEPCVKHRGRLEEAVGHFRYSTQSVCSRICTRCI